MFNFMWLLKLVEATGSYTASNGLSVLCDDFLRREVEVLFKPSEMLK